jgi:hypothetical protein
MSRYPLDIQFLPSYVYVGPDGVVDIATRYWLDGLGIEFRWGRDFQHSSGRAMRPTQPPIQCILGLFPGERAAEG